jgi:hypothetical protein
LPTGSTPQDLALIDLNGDGKLDLVIANANDDAVTVQLGNGDRTFGAAQSYAVGRAPTRLAVADVDGDGKLDIVASNSQSFDVTLLLATTPGNFAAARTFVADQEPQVLALGDFNGDGLLDAVAATQGVDNATVAILRNRGDGSLHGVEDLRAGNGPSALAVADLDGDGLPDLLAGGDGGELLIFPSAGNGFAPPITLNVGGRTLGVAARDLNGDSQPDIIVTDNANSQIAISLSQGGGRFAPAALYSTAPNPVAVAVGDFNGDGRPDVAVAAYGAESICSGGPQPPPPSCTKDDDCAPGGVCITPGKASVLLQQPNGTFATARSTDVDEKPTGIAVVDLNCDGKDDLLVPNLMSSTVSALRSNGDGSFTLVQTLSAAQVGQSPSALAVADFDRDGVDDFAVTNMLAPSGANVHLFRGNCSGPFAAFGGQMPQIGLLANSIVARDFTGDQIVDLAVTSQNSNEVCLLAGRGDGTMGRVGNSNSCDRVSRMPIALAAGDFDADGRYDAASANNDQGSNNLSVLFNCARDPGCDPFPNPNLPPPPPKALRGDGNSDGRTSAADLVAVGREVMDNDGFQVEAIGGGSYKAGPGVDANGDGRVDAQDRLAVAHRIFSGA